MRIITPSIRFIGLIIGFYLLISLGLANSDPAPEPNVLISWEDLEDLLSRDQPEITLDWSEFQYLLQLAGGEIKIPHTTQAGGQVTISREHFHELIQKIPPPMHPVPDSEHQFVITKAEYSGILTPLTALMDVAFHLVIYPTAEPSYLQIPFLPQEVALVEILLDGNEVPVLIRDGWYNLLTEKSGNHQLQVRFHTTSTWDDSDRVFYLRTVPTAITELSMKVPEVKGTIDIPRAYLQQFKPQDDGIMVTAVLPATSEISMHLHRQFTPAIGDTTVAQITAPRIYAENTHLLTLDAANLQLHSRSTLTILEAPLRQLRIWYPEQWEIMNVTSSAFGRNDNWTTASADSGQILTIPMEAPVSDHLVINITAEHPIKPRIEEVLFQGPYLLDVSRERGFLGVVKTGTVEVESSDALNLERLDIQELPVDLVQLSARPLLFGYRYLELPFALGVALHHHAELPTISCVIDLASIVSVVTEQAQMVTRAEFTVRNTWKQFLELDLPEDAEIWTVNVSGRKELASRSPEGKILIPLSRSDRIGNSLSSFMVDIIYLTEVPPEKNIGQSTISLPATDVLISKLLWSVYLPEDNHYLHFSGDLEKEELARTVNLLKGARRGFSTAQADHYNRVATELEAPSDYRSMNERDKKVTSKFMNSAIAPEDLANQIRQEAKFNANLQPDALIQPGIAGISTTMFRINLPTEGQIYRFGQTLVESTALDLNITYVSTPLLRTFQGLILLILVGIFALLRRRIWPLLRRGAAAVSSVLHWAVAQDRFWLFFASARGLRIGLLLGAIFLYWFSIYLFVVTLLLLLIACIWPHWLLPHLRRESKKKQKDSISESATDTPSAGEEAEDE